MLTATNNDKLKHLVKSNPEFESIIENLIEENKRHMSMFVHELRNPLSLIKGTVQYIETKHPEVKEFKYWDQLQDLAMDLEHLMADASLLNAYNSLNKEHVDLLSLMNVILNSFMPQSISNDIKLELNVNPGCVSLFNTYSCDSVKLKQALSNLVKNAFEATTPGDFININLDYLPEDDQSLPCLSIQVCNNGLPIPEDEIGNIFFPFVTYKKTGTGIGLALVKKIIDLHYGSISVTSDEHLTSFNILLPL